MNLFVVLLVSLMALSVPGFRTEPLELIQGKARNIRSSSVSGEERRSKVISNNESSPKHLPHRTRENTSSSEWGDALFPDNQSIKVSHWGPNITNCVWTEFEGTWYYRLECRSVNINDTAQQIPSYVTILAFYNCSTTTKSRNLTSPVLSHLTELQRLDIGMSGIEYIGSSFLTGLMKLRELLLRDNFLVALDPDLLKNVPTIRYLDFRGNFFSDVNNVATAASVLPNLTTLILDINKNITEILVDDLLPLHVIALETLSLSNCGIRTIESDAFKSLPYLKTLVLGNNKFNTDALLNITKGVKWTKVEHLQLRNLSSVFAGGKFITKELQPLNQTKIAFLDLDFNRIHKLEHYAFPKLNYLRKLRLCYCGLQYISPKAFHELGYLQELYLTHNKLKQVHFEIPSLHVLDISTSSYGGSSPKQQSLNFTDRGLENCVNMRRFVLRKSYFQGPITKYTFTGLVSLQSLEISYTYLKNISSFAFSELHSLKHLILAYNSLTVLQSKMFDGLANVTQLYLSNNVITSITDPDIFTPLISLVHLALHDNLIKILPENLFIFNAKLVSVSLGNNELQSWDHKVFLEDSSLQELLLQNNEIEDVTPSMLSVLKRMKSIDLSGNPFICSTCNMRLFQIFINSSESNIVKNPRQMSCSDSASGNESLLHFSIPEELCLLKGDKNGIVLSVSLTITCLVIVGFLLSLCKLRCKVPEVLRASMLRYREMRQLKSDDRVKLENE